MDFLFSSTAFAQEAAQAATKAPSTFEILAMPVGFLLIMYFFIIRPQTKKAKDHANLVAGLKAGDEVVTSGGIIGKVRSVADNFVNLEIAPTTSIKVLKGNVQALTKQPEAAKAVSKVPAKA